MGCDVAVFSSSEVKKTDAMDLDTTEFCLLPKKSEEAALKINGSINVLPLYGGELPNFN
jgi:hypothetical protein